MCTGAWLRDTLAIMVRTLSIGAELPSSSGPSPCTMVSTSSASSILRSFSPVLTSLRRSLDLDRLGDEVEGAELERAHRGLDVAVGGDHGHRYGRRVALHPLHQLETVAVGQAHVREAQVVADLQQLRRASARSAVVSGRVSMPFEGHGQQLADIGLVVDDEDGGLAH